jgi:predicted ATPase
MLTRLKVSGFKNLYNVDVRFGPFTCIAGTNGVGKSNLFDAIEFLSKLAEHSLVEAALSVRDEGGKTGDIRSLFLRMRDEYSSEMSFAAEMIIPSKGIDELGQAATASSTFLSYKIKIGYRTDSELSDIASLEILEEELKRIYPSNTTKHILFPHHIDWRRSAIPDRLPNFRTREKPYFISTRIKENSREIVLHTDGGRSGREIILSAGNLPRTVLSFVNASESPTALLAKREMQSWRILQLEPSALRQPDNFTSPTKLQANGSHLAANIYHLARFYQQRVGHINSESKDDNNDYDLYTKFANSLANLIDDIDTVWVDRDNRRELLTLMVKGKDGIAHPARSLSDGTMRFLALAALQLDPIAQGLLCLEEPENGIHPERIPKILDLLQNIATNPHEPIGEDNPLRQVIINTHSPAVVQQVPDDSLLVAERKSTFVSGKRFKRVCFSCLPETWRYLKDPEPSTVNVVAKGQLLSYLNPVPLLDDELDDLLEGNDKKYSNKFKSDDKTPKRRRVVDREDVRQLLIPGL